MTLPFRPPSGHPAPDGHHLLVTETEAPTWEDGLIVGSGRVGAVVHGPADRLVITLAHERYFLPVNPRPPAPDLAAVREGLRRAALDGDDRTAAALLDQGARADGYDDGLIWTDPLGICATVTVSTPGGVESARRTIDPRHGEVAVEWLDLTGGRHALRMLAPRDGQTVWLAIEADTETGTGSGSGSGSGVTFSLGLGDGDVTSFDTGVVDASTAVRAKVTGGAVGRLSAEATTAHGSARTAVTVSTGAPWQSDGTTAQSQAPVGRADSPGGGLIRIDVGVDPHAHSERDPGSVTTRDTAAHDTAADTDTHTAADTDDDAPAATWDDLRARHRRTLEPLTGASVLDLDAPETAGLTEELWAAARTGDDAARRRVLEIAYLSGRANIIAATGELPATLQGVWQGTWRPAWSADYTLNGNVQNGGLASLIPTGTPELARSLLTLLLEHPEDYRENARRVFGAEGMLLPSRMSTHGRADHFSPEYPHLFWIGCGGWALRIAADLVSTTGDRSIVDDRLWELAEGVLRFAETGTTVIGGARRLLPSYSPENTPGGARFPIAADATVDIAVLRDAARATALLGRARGDDSFDARWSRLIAQLPAYRVAANGTLAEWADPAYPENHAHRHASQLYPLWYEIDPAFAGDAPGSAPEPDSAAGAGGGSEAERLRAAAAATVAEKIAWRAEDPTAPPGRMEMAFGLVQLGLAAAALGDAESALTCAEWLAVDHWRPTLTTTHDAGRIFNLDASGGLPAVVAAMLVGSTADSVTLLPALPDAWARGSVTGLRARGGIVVDRLEWDERGAAVELRRLPAAAWLAPSDGTSVLVPSGCTVSAEGRTLPSGARLRLGERPLRLRMSRSRDLEGDRSRHHRGTDDQQRVGHE